MDAYIGQIIMFGGNFAPRNWAFCSGALLPISQYTALFSILGTMYGGDGRTTFGLPDLRGRGALHPGQGPGLPSYFQGQKGGVPSISQPPAHTHAFNVPANTGAGTADTPAGNHYASAPNDHYNSAAGASMGQGTTASTGAGSVPVQNPFQCVNFIICLQGLFPPRS